MLNETPSLHQLLCLDETGNADSNDMGQRHTCWNDEFRRGCISLTGRMDVHPRLFTINEKNLRRLNMRSSSWVDQYSYQQSDPQKTGPLAHMYPTSPPHQSDYSNRVFTESKGESSQFYHCETIRDPIPCACYFHPSSQHVRNRMSNTISQTSELFSAI